MMQEILNQRLSGVILHPTSLPSNNGPGRLGAEAYAWIDWLHQAGFKMWQILPLTPVADGSPYNSYSAFAGNTDLIDADQLQHMGFPGLDKSQPLGGSSSATDSILRPYFHWLNKQSEHGVKGELNQFIQQTDWLRDYCLFRIIKQRHMGSWIDWPEELRSRNEHALETVESENKEEYQFQQFLQFLFHKQWHQLKQHANNKGIKILGDLPIFVAHDSADVWACQSLYKLEPNGHPTVVAGVPPDYFSATGQRWGNPIYHWQNHQDSNFEWWIRRINHSLTLYDVVRIDHFRGFVACWEIPADEPTAINGHWVDAPGEQLFEQLLKERGNLPLVAEDLGIITDEVVALRKRFNLLGMKILHFAFDSDGFNPYLPHNHTHDSIIYTGTHDNNTTVGWYQELSPEIKDRVMDYFSQPSEAMPWPLIKSALASPANWALVPLQDLLELGAEHRMNTPGTVENNWQWQFQWSQVPEDLAQRLSHLNHLYLR